MEFTDAFYLFQRAFIDALLGRGAPPQPAADNLRTLEATFAAYAAAECGESSPSAPSPAPEDTALNAGRR